MLKKLTEHGNSLSLVIDRPVLELPRFDADTALEISTDGKRLIIAASKPSPRRKKFEAAQAEAHQRFSKALRKLAE
jgi:antitoxin component of MazEF toxin-antitoxin module